MPRYFFDIHDSGPTLDSVGLDCPNLDAVRREALRILPDIAREEVPDYRDRRTFTVLVTNEDGLPIFAATLNLTALWLRRGE